MDGWSGVGVDRCRMACTDLDLDLGFLDFLAGAG